MPGEPKRSEGCCGLSAEQVRWLEEKIATAQKHLTDIANERDIRYEQRYRSQQEGIQSAKQAQDDRLNAMNEIREQLKTQREEFTTLTEYRTQHAAIITDMTNYRKESDDKMEVMRNNTGDKIASIISRQDKMEAAKQGGSDSWRWAQSVIGTLIGVGLLALALVTLFKK